MSNLLLTYLTFYSVCVLCSSLKAHTTETYPLEDSPFDLCRAIYENNGYAIITHAKQIRDNLNDAICLLDKKPYKANNLVFDSHSPIRHEMPLCLSVSKRGFNASFALMLLGAKPDVICKDKHTPIEMLLDEAELLNPNDLALIALLIAYHSPIPNTKLKASLQNNQRPISEAKHQIIRELNILFQAKPDLQNDQVVTLCSLAKNKKSTGLFVFLFYAYGEEGIHCFELSDKRLILNFNEPILHIASAYGLVWLVKALLKDKNIDSNQLTDDHFSALHFAALVGDVEIMALLLEGGAELYPLTPLHQSQDGYIMGGESPLSCAYGHDHGPAFDFLLQKMIYNSDKKLFYEAMDLLQYAVHRPEGSLFHLTAPANFTLPLFNAAMKTQLLEI